MKRFVLLLATAPLLAIPAGADAADLVLRHLDISIGVNRPEPVRTREVVYVRERDDDREGHRRHRHEWKRHEWKKKQSRREEPRVIVIDERGRHCDTERVVVKRPGRVVVIADGRRW